MRHAIPSALASARDQLAHARVRARDVTQGLRVVVVTNPVTHRRRDHQSNRQPSVVVRSIADCECDCDDAIDQSVSEGMGRKEGRKEGR